MHVGVEVRLEVVMRRHLVGRGPTMPSPCTTQLYD
jgi:hypothetical protein